MNDTAFAFSTAALSRTSWVLVLSGLALLLAIAGCESEDTPENYVARVGEYTLTENELDEALRGVATGMDTSEARRQVIEQWTTRTLLLREALRLNLESEPEVQKKLEEQRRAVLVNALTSRFYEEASTPPSDAEVRSYFERNRQQMTLREPYVRVRHLIAETESDAEAVRDALREAEPDTGAVADSVWTALTRQYATAPEEARDLSTRFVSESRLFATRPYIRDELTELDDGDVSPVTEDEGGFHVVELIRRIPPGTEPELAWVEDEVRRRLAVRSRKQMYMREVQRLRNEATAQNELEVR